MNIASLSAQGAAPGHASLLDILAPAPAAGTPQSGSFEEAVGGFTREASASGAEKTAISTDAGDDGATPAPVTWSSVNHPPTGEVKSADESNPTFVDDHPTATLSSSTPPMSSDPAPAGAKAPTAGSAASPAPSSPQGAMIHGTRLTGAALRRAEAKRAAASAADPAATSEAAS